MLNKEGGPFYKVALVAAPLGSGMTTLMRAIARQQNRDLKVLDAADFKAGDQPKEDFSSVVKAFEAKVNAAHRLIGGQRKQLFVVENAENLSAAWQNAITSKLKLTQPLLLTTA